MCLRSGELEQGARRGDGEKTIDYCCSLTIVEFACSLGAGCGRKLGSLSQAVPSLAGDVFLVKYCDWHLSMNCIED